ncbi:hypothetical protein [Paenibacillus protaetiae]|uniref:hypothetical protein n=1 Tax=Paenibacillus protaetiae TaxID=2509456 RepID=UPI001FC94562|nr:hypothetical protein [Paenibacillus protaetiae]
MSKRWLVHWLDEQKPVYEALAKSIWEKPELAFQEHFAAQSQIALLRSAGFRVTDEARQRQLKAFVLL